MNAPGPTKNPARVPMSLQAASTPAELVGTAGTTIGTPFPVEAILMAQGDFKFNPQNGHWEAQRDGVYQRQAQDPREQDRVQMRKGHAVTEADAKLFSRVGGWPGEPDEDAIEQQATAATAAKAAPAPENKAAPAPETKSA